MTDAICVKNITKVYRIPTVLPWKPAKLTKALQNVSFACPREKISCLLGPNGAGKTTIIKILAGLILPDAGDATTLGTVLSKTPLNFRVKVGLSTPNERSFYWRLTGYQNLDFYASLYGLAGKIKRDRISEVLDEVDLSGDSLKPYRLYSAGMKQKLLLARALLCRPDILLLDEPTTHLDPIVRSAIHKLIRERFIGQRKTSILLCTHDLTEAQELADHLIFLNEGQVRAEGTLSALRAKIQPHIRLILEFDQLPRRDWEKSLPILGLKYENKRIELEVSEKNTIPDIVHSVVTAGGRLLSCRHHEESLNDIFTRLSGGGIS
ncbi:MAG: ABC transporter ATP-binding protein [Candidatus Latescibacteria bacterium]|nr:ABC transporter ATP-binding protein [Candidatus Latescibacterota bacterium]